MILKKEILSNKIWLIILILISILLIIPSIRYLLINKTVDNFNSYFTYDLEKHSGEESGRVNGILFISLFLLYSLIYLLIIKFEKEIFGKKISKVLIYILVISLIFMMMLPILSSDIFYYIGDSWVAGKYHQNPYYTTVKDLQDKGINDEILQNTGYWKNTTSVYGPLYNMIATVLVMLSFGNINIALFTFKFAALLIHILNCYLVYKLTKRSKYTLIYGLNPLILIEFLCCVHNDIYLILFILLSMYYLIRKRNIPFSIIFLALSVSVKYSSILLVPYILIFIFQKHKFFKRLLYCIGTGLIIIAIVILLYLPYYRDMSIFTNMMVQDGKLSQSLMLILYRNLDENIYNSIDKTKLPAFAIIYITSLICLLAKRKIILRESLRKYNIFLILFIFVILTTFRRWYILWLLPTYFWQRKYMKNFIISLTIVSMIPEWNYFLIGGDSWKAGVFHSVKMFAIAIGCTIIIELIKKYVLKKFKKLSELWCT